MDKKNAYETTKKNVLYDMKTFLPSPGVYVVQLSSGRSEKTSTVTPLFFSYPWSRYLRKERFGKFQEFFTVRFFNISLQVQFVE